MMYKVAVFDKDIVKVHYLANEIRKQYEKVIKLKRIRPRFNKNELALIIDGLKDLSFYSHNEYTKDMKNVLLTRLKNFYDKY